MSKYGNPLSYRSSVDTRRHASTDRTIESEDISVDSCSVDAQHSLTRAQSSGGSSRQGLRSPGGLVRQGLRTQRRLPRMNRIGTEEVRSLTGITHEIHSDDTSRPSLKSSSTFKLLSAFDCYPDAPPKDIRLNACLERLFERYKRLERDGSWETSPTTGERTKRKRQTNKRETSFSSYNLLSDRDRISKRPTVETLTPAYDSFISVTKSEISDFVDQNRNANSYKIYRDIPKSNVPGPRLNQTENRKKRSEYSPTALPDSVRSLRIRADKFLRDFESLTLKNPVNEKFILDVNKDSDINAEREAEAIAKQDDLEFCPQLKFVPPRATCVRRTRSLAASRGQDSIRHLSKESTAASRGHNKTNKTFASSWHRQRSVNRNVRSVSSRQKYRRASPEYSRSIRSYPESSQHNVTRTFDQLQQNRRNTPKLQRDRQQPLSQAILNQAICQLYGLDAKQYVDGVYSRTESDHERKNGSESEFGGRTSRYESPRNRDSLIVRMTSEADEASKEGVYQSSYRVKQKLINKEYNHPGSISVSNKTNSIVSKTKIKSRDQSAPSLIPRPIIRTSNSSAKTIRSKSAGITSINNDTIKATGNSLSTPMEQCTFLPSNFPQPRNNLSALPSKIPVAIRRLAKSCPINVAQSANVSSRLSRDLRLSNSRSRLSEKEPGPGSRSRVSDNGKGLQNSRSAVGKYATRLSNSSSRINSYDPWLSSLRLRISQNDLQLSSRSRSLSKHHNATYDIGLFDSERLVRKRIGMSDGELNLHHHLWGMRGQLNPMLCEGIDKRNVCDSYHVDDRQGTIAHPLVESVVRPAGLERIIQNLVSQYRRPPQMMSRDVMGQEGNARGKYI